MTFKASLAIVSLAVHAAHAQFSLGNFTSAVGQYYSAIMQGAGLAEVWDIDWKLVPLPAPVFPAGTYVNIGIHYGTTILSAGGQGLIGGAGQLGSTHHTCYVGNLLPPTCMTQHWAASAGAQFGPGVNEGDGFEQWRSFKSDFGNCFIGFVIERVYEVDANMEEVVGSRLSFDDYDFLSNQATVSDFANALWFWSSPGKMVDQHPGGRNVTYIDIKLKPLLALGSKELKFTFLFTNAWGVLDTTGLSQLDTSLTSKSMEAFIEVTSWEYTPPEKANEHRLAVEINFFTAMSERTTYGANGIDVVSTTVSDTAKRQVVAATTDGFETMLPSEGVLSVWETGGDWVNGDPNKMTYFTISHTAKQGEIVANLIIKQLRYDHTTGKDQTAMKNALYDDYSGVLDDAFKTVWNVGQFYFLKLFKNAPMAQTASVYEFHLISTRPGVSRMIIDPGMGVGPWINPAQTQTVPDIVAPTCTDKIRNQGETSVDCGGPRCPLCETCDNGVKDQNEQLTDCGGPNCPACDPSLINSDDSSNSGIPFWVWIIVGVVACLLFVFGALLLFFLVLAGGKKPNNKHVQRRESSGSLRYGTQGTMGGQEMRKHTSGSTPGGGGGRSGRSRGGTHMSRSRAGSQATAAELPQW